MVLDVNSVAVSIIPYTVTLCGKTGNTRQSVLLCLYRIFSSDLRLTTIMLMEANYGVGLGRSEPRKCQLYILPFEGTQIVLGKEHGGWQSLPCLSGTFEKRGRKIFRASLSMLT